MPTTKYTVSISNLGLSKMTTDRIHRLIGHSVSWTWVRTPSITSLLYALIPKGEPLTTSGQLSPCAQYSSICVDFPLPPLENGSYIL